MSLLHCYCTALLTAGHNNNNMTYRTAETFENPEPADGALLRVRSGLASAPVETRFPVVRDGRRSPNAEASASARARIDNSPPPVCTRSVRLSIGHQGIMKYRSPLSKRMPNRSRCVSSVYHGVRYQDTSRHDTCAGLATTPLNAYDFIPRYDR